MSAPRTTRMNLITYDEDGKANSFHSDFGRASFSRESDNRIELVFRNQVPSRLDPTQTITQMVYIEMFWAPRYGVTRAESTQINANVQYAILTPPTGVRYDGGAFVTYKVDPFTKELYGWIETGDLTPALKMGNAVEPFGPARIYGTFRAVDNGSDVVNVCQQLKTQFTSLVERK
jgi:hypothetical protein